MAMSGRGRGGRGGGGNDRRAAPTQRIASGARTAPYARPGGPSRQASSGSLAAGAAATASEGQPWPPNQISIKGASGPTWIVVSNLVLGVSDADIRETFQQFGAIESVKVSWMAGVDPFFFSCPCSSPNTLPFTANSFSSPESRHQTTTLRRLLRLHSRIWSRQRWQSRSSTGR